MRGRFIAVLLLSIVSPAVAADAIAGRVARVVDGDTLILQGQRVRLQNADAPELSEPAGRASRDYLQRLVEGRDVVCQGRARDRYKRLVATCSVDGRDVGQALVRAGHATAHPWK